MNRNLYFFLALALTCSTAKADFMFSIVPSSTTIQLGQTATFDLFITPSANYVLQAFDAAVEAGDRNTNGSFIGSSNLYAGGGTTTGLPDPPLPDLGYIFFTANIPAASRNFAANVPVRFATVTLSTDGAVEGPFNVQYDAFSFAIIKETGPDVGTVSGNFVPMNITAVPEPSAFSLMLLAGTVSCLYLAVNKVLFRVKHTPMQTDASWMQSV